MMLGFALAAAVMIGVALAFVLTPLVRGRAVNDVDRAAANVAVLRDQLAELDGELARGAISAEHHQRARLELERRVLEDTAPAAAASERRAAPLVPVAVLAAALPLAALFLYVAVGEPAVLLGRAPMTEADGHQSDEAIGRMVAKLAARLADEPDDGKGWLTLGRSYMALQRPAEAVEAYARAAKLMSNDASVLADYADALATVQGGTLTGRPIELVREALAIDPNQWKALALAGTEAFHGKRYTEAIGYWEKVRAVASADSPIGQSIETSIAEARALASAAGRDAPKQVAAAPRPATAAIGAGITGSVALTEALRAKVAPGDTVFVFARAAEGPRVPLAILKKQVKDLPFDFKLDDSMGMTPELKLSSFPELVLIARISKSGNASTGKGDLEGSIGPVKIGASGVKIVVDREMP